MGRRTKSVTINDVEDTNRDKGKVFLLTEMSPLKIEKWAARALLAIMRSGIDIPKDAVSAGVVGLASMGPRLIEAFNGLKWEELEPLLDEMMSCVQVQPDPRNPMVLMALLPEEAGANQIEEVTTLLTLRKEILELHLGFSMADKLSSLAAKGKEQSTSM